MTVVGLCNCKLLDGLDLLGAPYGAWHTEWNFLEALLLGHMPHSSPNWLRNVVSKPI